MHLYNNLIKEKEINRKQDKKYCEHSSEAGKTKQKNNNNIKTLCLAFTVFQFSNIRSTIKIQLCHGHYKLMWNFPDMLIDVP